jgi:serine/threonine protein kinase
MDPDLIQNVSEEARNLMCKMLRKKPDARITPSEALCHPWFDEIKEEPKEGMMPKVQDFLMAQV